MIQRILLSFFSFLTGLGAFAQFSAEHTVIYQGSNGTIGVHAADLDGDGDADPISASVDDSQIAWYENLGDGHFGMSRVIATDATGITTVFSADLDGDGDPDMLYASADSDIIAWYENTGAGAFGPRQIVCDTVDGASDVYSIDLDNDGDYDILSASRNDNKIAWYPNTGNGSFGPQQLISDQVGGALSVVAKDLSLDGLPDVVAVGSSSNVVGWFRNLGGGTFSSLLTVSTEVDGLVDVAAEDIDADGWPDIVSASVNDHKIAWYRNLGNGSFSTQNIASLQVYDAQSIFIAAIDDNATKDILVAGTLFNNPNNAYMVYCRNLGSSFYWTPIELMPNEAFVNTVFASDLDNDNDDDILFASGLSEFDAIGWLENTETVDFPHSRFISDQLQRPTDVCTADLNGDGALDIVSAADFGAQISWYPNLGANTYGLPQVIAYELRWWNNAVHTADLDMDGDQDVLSATDTQLVWFENNGTGVFGGQQGFGLSDSQQITDIHTMDMDGDGDPEVFAADYGSDRICWYENLGGGNFGPMNTVTNTADQVNTFGFADVDNDGLQDIVSGFYYVVAWYKNLGDGTFGPQQTIGSFEGHFEEVTSGDMDNDGDLDIAAGGMLRAVWFENTGAPTYWPEHVINSDHDTYYTISTTDIDLDGDLDVFSAGAEGTQTPGPGEHVLFWHENLGGGNLGPEQILDHNAYGVFLSDLDNDSDPEVLLYGNHRIGWKENYFIHATTTGGLLFADMNQNQLMDAGDYPLQQTGILTNPENAFSYTFNDGSYILSFDETIATYEFFPQEVPHWNITSDSLSYHLTTDSLPGNNNGYNFSFYPTEFVHEVQPELIGAYPRCNTTVNYWLTIRNTGSLPAAGTIHLQLDDALTFSGSDIAPASINGQHIYWNYDSLMYFSEQQMNIRVQMPDFTSMGDEIQSLLTVTADSSGVELFSDTDTLSQVLVCAYDPNDKTAVPAGEDSLGSIPMSTEWMEYTIRFQNTGNDTAVNVIIRDQIDSHLNRNSFHLLASSHPVSISGNEGGEMVFSFHSIMLPDSTTNEMGSHGFIRYRIRLNENLPVGTVIENTAHIYFDQNPVVITNTTIHTLSSGLGIEELASGGIRIFPNPFNNSFTITFPEQTSGDYDLTIYSITGSLVFNQQHLTGKSHSILLPDAPKGIYFVSIVNALTGERMIGKVVAE